jgi:hypothetical protein
VRAQEEAVVDTFGIALIEPEGKSMRRRLDRGLEATNCQKLDAAAIAALRSARKAVLSFGTVTLRPGGWLDALERMASPGFAAPGEIFRVDLNDDHQLVRVTVTARLSFAVAFCAGKVVVVRAPVSGPVDHMLRAQRIDAVAVMTLDPSAVEICVEPVDHK